MVSTFLGIYCSVINFGLLVSCYYSEPVIGKYINGSEIITIDTIGPSKCGQHCLSITGCLGYNYDREMLHCRLLSDNSSTGSLIESEKMDYENRENILPDMNGLCINADCPKFSQCVKLSSGQQICVRQLCDDPPPPIVSKEAAPLRKHFPIETTLRYNCIINDTSVNNTVTCKTNGQWTPVNQQCECGKPPRPFKKTPDCTHLGCEATSRCNWNFVMEGDGKMICSGHFGTWVHLNETRCLNSGCSDSTPVVMNANTGVIRCTSTQCRVWYGCKYQYRLHRRGATLICSLSDPVKSWTVPTLLCHYECAAFRPDVTNATLLDPHCSTTCTYICDDGYNLVGQSVRNCTVENGWDSGETSCESEGSGNGI